MLEVILIRPGSTDYDRQGRIQGTLEIPLSDEGRQEVARTCDELRERKFAALYSSPGQSAVETAETLAAALGVKVKRVEQLRNIDLGLWQGMMLEEVRLKHPRICRQWLENPLSVHPPEGESVAEAAQRVDAAVGRLLRKHKSGTIGIIVPEPLAGLAQAFLRHEDLTNLWKPCGGHCRWEAIVALQPAATTS
jgi:broad specificity phosphatase PhoE